MMYGLVILTYILLGSVIATAVNCYTDRALGIAPGSAGDWVGFIIILLAVCCIPILISKVRKAIGKNDSSCPTINNDDLFPGW